MAKGNGPEPMLTERSGGEEKTVENPSLKGIGDFVSDDLKPYRGFG
jgi:hypothetical protein